MRLLVRSLLLGLTFVMVAGEAQAGDNLDVLLNDAQYALNRYQELDNGAVCKEFRVAKHVQDSCARVQRAIGGNVERTKTIIVRVSKTRDPKNTDLLDIYSELEEVAGRLTDLGNDVGNFTERDGIQFAEAGDKTPVLAAKFYVELRGRICALENACARSSKAAM